MLTTGRRAATQHPRDLYVQPVEEALPHPSHTHVLPTRPQLGNTQPISPRSTHVLYLIKPGSPSAPKTVGRASSRGVLRTPRRARHPVHVTCIWNSYVQPNRQSASSPLTSITSPSPSPPASHPAPESKTARDRLTPDQRLCEILHKPNLGRISASLHPGRRAPRLAHGRIAAKLNLGLTAQRTRRTPTWDSAKTPRPLPKSPCRPKALPSDPR